MIHSFIQDVWQQLKCEKLPEKIQLSMMPATVNVPPTIAQTWTGLDNYIFTFTLFWSSLLPKGPKMCFFLKIRI